MKNVIGMEDELYRQELLERYRNPPNKKGMIKPDIKAEDANPLCGDHIEIFIRLGKEGKITEATFEGKGCVISVASASLLLEHLVGKTPKEAEEFTREDMLDLIGIKLTPTRVKCATLGLSTVKKGIKENKEKKSSVLPITPKANQYVEDSLTKVWSPSQVQDSVAKSNQYKLTGALQKNNNSKAKTKK